MFLKPGVNLGADFAGAIYPAVRHTERGTTSTPKFTPTFSCPDSHPLCSTKWKPKSTYDDLRNLALGCSQQSAQNLRRDDVLWPLAFVFGHDTARLHHQVCCQFGTFVTIYCSQRTFSFCFLPHAPCVPRWGLPGRGRSGARLCPILWSTSHDPE